MDFQKLTNKIKDSYETGVTMEEAEKLAGEFLHAQLEVASQLKVADLDARMRRSGVKAVKAGVYLDAVQKSDKKPSDVMLTAIVDTDETVKTEQDAYDASEVDKDYLENVLNILRDAHIHFRTIAKGNFNG